jgi:TetR/AcrR family transcriptional regulator, transcriptional repressor for nem operon
MAIIYRTPPMRYDPEHKERTRQRILAEAASAIRAKGPDRVGVAEVMAKLDLTHGGFYAHFASKDDLIAQAITYMLDERFAWFLRKTEGLEPKEALREFIDGYLSIAHRDSPSRGCALATLGGDLPRLPEAARTRFSEGAQRMVGAIAKLLTKLGAKNAESVASSAIAEMVGALALSRAVNDSQQSERILRTSRQGLMARLGVGADE